MLIVMSAVEIQTLTWILVQVTMDHARYWRHHVIMMPFVLVSPGFQPTSSDKICMMMTRLACNHAIESSYWRMDNDPDVGLLMGYVLYRLPIELEFMDLDTFSR
jgi:hypothetical protein